MKLSHAFAIMKHHFEDYDHGDEVNEAFKTFNAVVLEKLPTTQVKTPPTATPGGEICPACKGFKFLTFRDGEKRFCVHCQGKGKLLLT